MTNDHFTHAPRKRFGQNFLHDQNILEKMVAAIGPKPKDRIVEIGPGQGALTFPLLAKLEKLTAIELDRDLITPLQHRAREHGEPGHSGLGHGELEIHNSDALRFDFATLATPEQPIRVVGNLPYNISTPLIFHLLDNAPLIRDMHFLLQKEVVDRITAAPGGKDYGRLSVMVQYRCEAIKLFHVGPGAFHPPPKVDSAFIRIVPLSSPSPVAHDLQAFAALVKLCFTQRRKTLRRILKQQANEEHFTQAGIDPGLRPERLSVADFVNLSNAITLESTNGRNP
ncbi:MAG: 16S rRNA (adenine(1518)-N(6)/adenine(1519)-N(6))-dimethyltransferase RsmA [bacterium]